MPESNITFTAADDGFLDTQELVPTTYWNMYGQLMSTWSNASGAELDPPHFPGSDRMRGERFKNAPILT